MVVLQFFFQAEDGMRDLVLSRGLGDVYKRQDQWRPFTQPYPRRETRRFARGISYQRDERERPDLSLIHI